VKAVVFESLVAETVPAEYADALAGSSVRLLELDALPELRETIRRNYDDPVPRLCLSYAYRWLGRHQDAAVALEEAILISPDYWPLYFALADIHLVFLKTPHAAIRLCAEGLSLSPTWAPGHFLQGVAYFKVHDFHRASIGARNAIHHRPRFGDAHELLALALIYLPDSNLNEVLQQCHTAILHEPESIFTFLAAFGHDGMLRERLVAAVDAALHSGSCEDVMTALSACGGLLDSTVATRARGDLTCARLLLADTYQRIASRFGSEEACNRCIEQCEQLARLDSGLVDLLASAYGSQILHGSRSDAVGRNLALAGISVLGQTTWPNVSM
jgi:tetratricopeptide (TPR) repeat protein